MNHPTTYIDTSTTLAKTPVFEGAKCMLKQGFYPLFPDCDSNGKYEESLWDSEPRLAESLSPQNQPRDYESGFHYYGARYYWSEVLTGWLSVDPMMDKHPDVSSYTYCYWNPIKLIDPDGCDSVFGFKKHDWQYNSDHNPVNIYNNEKILVSTFPHLKNVIYLWGHGDENGFKVVNPDGNIQNYSERNYLITAKEYARHLTQLSLDYLINHSNNKESIIVSNMCHSGRAFCRLLSELLGDAIVIGPCDALTTNVKTHNQYFDDNTSLMKRKFSVNYKGAVVAYFWGFYNINGIIEKFGGEEKFIEAVHRWYDNYRKGGRTKTPIIK